MRSNLHLVLLLSMSCLSLKLPAAIIAEDDEEADASAGIRDEPLSQAELLQQKLLKQQQSSQPQISQPKNFARAQSQLSQLLPTPPGLEKDVQFWERIFADYSPDQCVFHDEWNLDVVYYVANVPRMYVPGGSPLLKRHLKALRTALQSIAARGKPAGEFEEKVYASIPQRFRNTDFLRGADERVRCQRGVEFEPSMKRSFALIPKIKAILAKKGLPEDLAYLPHLESGFDCHATSKAGAKGLWQFMKQTARSEGLRIKNGSDWRTDPDRATDAATDYLASIYLKVRSWDLAITSYNYGPNGVIRAVQKFGADYMKIRQEHRTKMFGFAARNYYPSFLAVRNVAIRLEKRLAMGDNNNTTLADGDEVRRKTKTF